MPEFDLVGGRPSLDFLNTMSGLRVVNPSEKLLAYPDLIAWARQARLIDGRRAARLLAEAERHPRRAALALEEAIALREALHDVIVAGTEGREASPAALDTVNQWIASSLQHRRLRAKGPGKFELAFEDDGDWLAFLRPLAVDAAELLTRELPSGRVHICEQRSEESCGWFFLDETRNHSRRWCSMRDCGNRAKQRRHWQRNRPRTSDLGPQGTRASTAK
jgi:predicted RNA-binding Zn ribbon-like protein